MFSALILTTALLPAQSALPSSSSGEQSDFASSNLFPAATYQPQAPEAGITPVPRVITVPFLGPPQPTTGATPTPAAPGPAAVLPERWWLMKQTQGTWLGALLDDNRLYLNGWIEQAYTASSDRISNYPMIFNDRANEYLLQQAWVKFGRKLITVGTTVPSWGFEIDVLNGSDYRWTLPRGLFNSQLDNHVPGSQNLYGVDLIQQYMSLYVPTFFRGTELRLGRVYAPYSFDSLEGVTTPLLSRSYSFENTPFTLCGLAAYVTFSTEWTGLFMLANGNDIYWGDPAEELRFAGDIKWTQTGGRNIVQFATSLGRGKFNPAFPTPPQQTTVSLATEPFGRNNINVFDFLYTHVFSSVLSYNLEVMYGYQYNVPQASLPIADPSGFVNWGSILHYIFYDVGPRTRLIVRWEDFDDFRGQRTGFAGLYNAVTAGFRYQLNPSMILRPEVRYDYNFESTPFEGKHGLFTATIDTIIRW